MLAVHLVDGKRNFVQESNFIVARWNFEKKAKEKQLENLKFILLTDILLVCENKDGQSFFKEMFKLDDTMVINVQDNSYPPLYGKNAKNIFELHRIDDHPLRFIIYCKDNRQKTDWISSIDQSKEIQKKNKESK